MPRLIDRLSTSIGDSVAWVYVAVFVITVYDVAARYAFNAPTAWGTEIVIALCGIHYVMSGAMALQRNDHVRIDVIYSLLPPPVKYVCDLLSGCVIIVVLIALIWFGWNQAQPAIRSWETTGTAWNSPTPVFMKLAIPVAGVLMLIQATADLFRCVKAGMRPPSALQ